MNTLKLLFLIAFLFSSTFGWTQNKIYVSDANGFNVGPWKIIQYDQDGSNPVTYIDEELGWPQDIVFLSDQNEVLISNLNTNKITRYEATSGNYISDFATVSGGPTRMRIGSDNLLYVIQWSLTDNNVKRYQLDGTFVDEFTTVGVPRGIGMDWDSLGNLYVSSFNGNNVRKYDSSGNDLGLIITSNLNGPTNVEVIENDDFLVLNWNGGNVVRFDSSGNYIGEFIGGLGQCEGIDFRPNGNILIGNGTTAEVKEYQSNGNFVGNTVISGSGGLAQPNAVILFDPSVLSIEEQQPQSIRLVYPTIGAIFTLQSGIEDKQNLDVFDITGKKVDSIIANQKQWNASHLSPGMYFINHARGAQKIIVKH